MKLFEIMSMRNMQREHIMDLIEDYLMTHNFKLKIHRAIDALEDEQMEKLKGMLYAVALDNYDYGTDSGASIYIPEETIVAALQQMRAL